MTIRLLAFLLLILNFSSLSAQKLFNDSTFKFSGYLQTQYQIAQSAGIFSWSGGDFDKEISQRFMIRRARIKLTKTDKLTKITLQADANADSFRLIEGHIRLKPTAKSPLSFTAGLFDKPFGYAITYSSANSDFLEHPKVFQQLFPKEKDMGAMLTFKPSKILKANIALVNGSGLTTKDYDNRKDFIGNVHLDFDKIKNGKITLGLGLSMYAGWVKNIPNYYYVWNNNGFTPENKQKYLNKNYYGADFQISLKNNFGQTDFKTEYLTGKQPGLAYTYINNTLLFTNPIQSSRSFNTQPTDALYLRKFEGYYFWLSQQIGQSDFSLLFNYDVYDPNVQVSGKYIGKFYDTSAGDIKFTTFGYGLKYNINKQVKLTLYYDNVINENSQLIDYLTDKKDDVFTIRLQYKW